MILKEKVEAAIKKMGKKNARLYYDLRRSYQEQGEADALEKARALLESQQNISIGDRERLSGYLDGVRQGDIPRTAGPINTGVKNDGARWTKDVQVLWQYDFITGEPECC